MILSNCSRPKLIISSLTERQSSDTELTLNRSSCCLNRMNLSIHILKRHGNSLALFRQNVRTTNENSSISIFIDKYLFTSSDCVIDKEYSMRLISSNIDRGSNFSCFFGIDSSPLFIVCWCIFFSL